MDRIAVRLVFAAVFVYGSLSLWNHFHQAAMPTVDALAERPDSRNIDPPSTPLVTVRGPLADFVSQGKPAAEVVEQPYKPSAEGRVEDSPVGTSAHILHRTFPVSRLVHVAFDIPPHAVTPHLRGTFSSYAQGAAGPSHDENANVDMLLMNEQQYAAFAAGHDPEVLLISDTSHYQDINFDLAPSNDQSVKYHLVFRNTQGGAAKKLVKADFTVDF